MAKMFNSCKLTIRAMIPSPPSLFISNPIQTLDPYVDTLYAQLGELAIKPKQQQIKVVQYKTIINKKTNQIQTQVIFYAKIEVNNSQEMGNKLKKRGYSIIDQKDELARKVRTKDYACVQFLSEEGDTVAVHEKNENKTEKSGK